MKNNDFFSLSHFIELRGYFINDSLQIEQLLSFSLFFLIKLEGFLLTHLANFFSQSLTVLESYLP